jgi:hypothetical protein
MGKLFSNERFRFFAKVTAAHFITYFVAAFIAYFLLHTEYMYYYMELLGFRHPDEISIIAVMIGQIIRGILLAIVIWWIKDSIIGKKLGWLKLWAILVILGIFNTYGPAHGSIEGFIYLDFARLEGMPGNALFSMLEVLAQPLLFSIIVTYQTKSGKRIKQA